jgi:hypothetical protein
MFPVGSKGEADKKMGIPLCRAGHEFNLHLFPGSGRLECMAGWRIAELHRNFAIFGELGTFPQHLLVLAALWLVCSWLYQNKLFLVPTFPCLSTGVHFRLSDFLSLFSIGDSYFVEAA